MGIGSFLGKTAVREILKLSPQIIEAAQQAAARFRAGRQRQQEEAVPDDRITRLEGLLEEQAALVAKLAAELGRTAEAAETLRMRVARLTLLSAAACILAAAAIVLVILR